MTIRNSVDGNTTFKNSTKTDFSGMGHTYSTMYYIPACAYLRTNDNFQVGRCVIIAHLICAGVLMLQRP